MFVFLLLASLFLTWLLAWTVDAVAAAAAFASELSSDVCEFIIHFCLQLHEKYHIYFGIILFSCFDAVFAARIFFPLLSCVCACVLIHTNAGFSKQGHKQHFNDNYSVHLCTYDIVCILYSGNDDDKNNEKKRLGIRFDCVSFCVCT